MPLLDEGRRLGIKWPVIFTAMKHAYLVALLLSACASPAWVTYPIDPYLTVQLPAKPKATNLDSMGINKLMNYKTLPFQAFLTEDDSGAYMVVIDASPRADSISANANRDALYTSSIRQVLARAEGNRLLSRTRFHTPAGEGVELVLRISSAKTHTPLLSYNRILLAHHRVYSFNFIPYEALLDSTAHTAQRRRFFDSITVKP